MTNTEAKAIAVQTFGPGAVTSHETIDGPDGVVERFTVGRLSGDGYSWSALGSGSSWGEAFLAAAPARRPKRLAAGL